MIGTIITLGVMGCDRLEREGALAYLVDNSGLRTSDGFHTIRKIDSQDEYLEKLGGLTYLLDKSGKTISFGFHEINPKSGGYKTELGDCEYNLALNGEVNSASSQSCLERLTQKQ